MDGSSTSGAFWQRLEVQRSMSVLECSAFNEHRWPAKQGDKPILHATAVPWYSRRLYSGGKRPLWAGIIEVVVECEWLDHFYMSKRKLVQWMAHGGAIELCLE